MEQNEIFDDGFDELYEVDGIEGDIDGVDNDSADSDENQLYEHRKVVVDPGQAPVRVDKYLADRMPHSSRNRIQNAADAGFIFVDGKAVKSNFKVRAGNVITLMLDRPRHDNTIGAEDIPLNIVYEDDELMVINKPAGMVVHPGAGNFHGTLINAVAWHLRDLKSFDPNDPEVGLVHRIDKDTSGLLVVAKTPNAKTRLGKQFFNKTTHRSYNALVWGNFIEDEGRIEGNIGRDPKDRLRMAVFDPDSGIGKNAVTHYRVLERFGYVTLIECILETGRTHQIRAHMKHIGHPLFADERYCVATAVLHIRRSFRIASNSATVRLYMPRLLALCILSLTNRWTSPLNGLKTLRHLSRSGAPLLQVAHKTKFDKHK